MNCPKCKEFVFPLGKFVDMKEVIVPLKIKVYFINLNINIKLNISYCPNCGFLKVTANQA